MIIYNTKLGNNELNNNAVELREIYKPLLKGITCHICAKDTVITWDKDKNMSPIINACCEAFKKKILHALKIKQ